MPANLRVHQSTKTHDFTENELSPPEDDDKKNKFVVKCGLQIETIFSGPVAFP